MTRGHVDAPNTELGWRYRLPDQPGAKQHLLTIGGVACHGVWYGELGQYFLAWAPLPKRDKQAERAILEAREATIKGK